MFKIEFICKCVHRRRCLPLITKGLFTRRSRLCLSDSRLMYDPTDGDEIHSTLPCDRNNENDNDSLSNVVRITIFTMNNL